MCRAATGTGSGTNANSPFAGPQGQGAFAAGADSEDCCRDDAVSPVPHPTKGAVWLQLTETDSGALRRWQLGGSPLGSKPDRRPLIGSCGCPRLVAGST